MKKRSKLSLHRETIALLEVRHLQVVGADCTCTCCFSICGPESCNCPTYSCESCPCDTQQADSRCVCI